MRAQAAPAPLRASGDAALVAAVRSTPGGLCYAPGDPAWCGELAAAEVGLALAINHALSAGVPVATLAKDVEAWRVQRLEAAARSHAALIDAYLHRTDFVEDATRAAERRSGRQAS